MFSDFSTDYSSDRKGKKVLVTTHQPMKHELISPNPKLLKKNDWSVPIPLALGRGAHGQIQHSRFMLRDAAQGTQAGE